MRIWSDAKMMRQGLREVELAHKGPIDRYPWFYIGFTKIMSE
jgi:hypothetical protein